MNSEEVSGRGYARGIEDAARQVDRLAVIARASPYWEDSTAEQLENLAADIRTLARKEVP